MKGTSPKKVKIPFYDALDRDNIQGTRRALKLLETFGYSSQSSPIDVYFDAGIDLCLSILTELRKEGPQRASQRFNRSLAFDEENLDPLGNPSSYSKQSREEVKFRQNMSKLYEDARTQDFFIALVAFFGRIKSGTSIETAFAACFKGWPGLTPIGAPSKDKKETTASLQKASTAAYYRRQRKR